MKQRKGTARNVKRGSGSSSPAGIPTQLEMFSRASKSIVERRLPKSSGKTCVAFTARRRIRPRPADPRQTEIPWPEIELRECRDPMHVGHPYLPLESFVRNG